MQVVVTHHPATDEQSERWVAVIPGDTPVEISGAGRAAVLAHTAAEFAERYPNVELTIVEVEG